MTFDGYAAGYFYDAGATRSVDYFDGVTVTIGNESVIFTGRIEYDMSASRPVVYDLLITDNQTGVQLWFEDWGEPAPLSIWVNPSERGVWGNYYHSSFGRLLVKENPSLSITAGDTDGILFISGENDAGIKLNFTHEDYAQFEIDEDGDGLYEVGRLVFNLNDFIAINPEEFESLATLNYPPKINGILSIDSTSYPIYADVSISAVLHGVFDPNGDELDYTYHWILNGEELAAISGQRLPANTASFGDTLQVYVDVDDGEYVVSSAVQGIQIADSLLEVVFTNTDAVVQSGSELVVALAVVDPDYGEEVQSADFELVRGPDGLTLEGAELKWTPSRGIFDYQSYPVTLRSNLTGDTDFTTYIKVKSEGVGQPLMRAGTPVPAVNRSIYIGQFDSDSGLEILTTDSESRIALLSVDSSGYQEQWEYPYAFSRSAIKQVSGVKLPEDAIEKILVLTAQEGLFYLPSLLSEPVSLFSIEDPTTFYAQFEVTDVDGDQSPEVLVMTSDGNLYLLQFSDGQILAQASPNRTSGEFEVADIDGNGTNEVVLGAGYVLDASTLDILWDHPDGFGDYVELADADGNGEKEIIGVYQSGMLDAYLFSSRQLIYSYNLSSISPTLSTVCSFDSANLDDDLSDEVVLGGCDQISRLTAYQVRSGQSLLQEFDYSAAGGVASIVAGDLGNDGLVDLVWASGVNYLAKRTLSVFDSSTETVYESQDASPIKNFMSAGVTNLDPDTPAAVFTYQESAGQQSGEPGIAYVDLATGTAHTQSFDAHRIEGSPVVGDYNADGYGEIYLGVLDTMLDGGGAGQSLVNWNDVIFQETQRSPSSWNYFQLLDWNGDDFLDLVYKNNTDASVKVWDIYNAAEIYSLEQPDGVTGLVALEPERFADMGALVISSADSLTKWTYAAENLNKVQEVTTSSGGCSALQVQNLDGNFYVSCLYGNQQSPVVDVYDSDLNLLHSVALNEGLSAHTLSLADGRLSILASEYSSLKDHSVIRSIPLTSGGTEWISNPVSGVITPQSMKWFQRSASESGLLFSTNMGMFVIQ